MGTILATMIGAIIGGGITLLVAIFYIKSDREKNREEKALERLNSLLVYCNILLHPDDVNCYRFNDRYFSEDKEELLENMRKLIRVEIRIAKSFVRNDKLNKLMDEFEKNPNDENLEKMSRKIAKCYGV